MIKRHSYRNSYMPFIAMETGRLQVLQQLPVVAGDSVGLMANFVFRGSPLRRVLALEPQIDFYAFWVPYRHIYPNWVQFIADGIDGDETLQSYTIPAGGVECLGFFGDPTATFPAHAIAGYARIWNRFFRVPSDNSKDRGFGELPDNWINNIDDASLPTQRYGHRIAQLKNQFNTGINADQVTDSDRDVPVGAGSFDLTDLRKQQAQYGSEQQQAYFNTLAGQRYTKELELKFGTGGINIDADERPEMLAMTSNFAGGQDINGTDTESLGRFTGKQAAGFNFGFPKKFFKEHGTIWIMCSSRFPPLYYDETDFITGKANPSYLEISGDPRFLEAQPPDPVVLSDHFPGRITPTGDFGDKPYANHYRNLPVGHSSREFYENVEGYPFLSSTDISNWRDLHYVDPRDYDEIYETRQQGHAQIFGNLTWDRKRIIPPAVSSVFAGAR